MARKPRPELAQMREAVMAAERKASRKASRMANKPHGYDVRGTELDPRKGRDWVARASMPQLQRQAARLTEFADRRVSYVTAGDGTPMKRQAYVNAKNAVKAYNRKLKRMNDKVADTMIPWRGMTAKETAEMTRPKHSWLESHAGQTMDLLNENFTPKRFIGNKNGGTAEKAAAAYAKMIRESMTPEAQTKRIDRMRDQFTKMADIIGDSELKQLANDLTDDQMWFAWTADRGLGDNVSLTYEMVQHLLSGEGANSTEFYVNRGVSTLEGAKEILRGAKTVNVPRYDY